MDPIPQPVRDETQAQSVSKILARSDPADMPAMRTSLSFLTHAGAELATALAKRNQEYDSLMAIVSTLPPEWIEAARTGGDLPDIGGLRAELQLATDQRLDLQAQLAERGLAVQSLEDQLIVLRAKLEAAGDQPLPAEMDEAQARIAALEGEIEAAQLARMETEEALRDNTAELTDLENEIAALSDDLLAALPAPSAAEESEPVEFAEPVESAEPVEPAEAAPAPPELSGRERRAVKWGTLAAAVSAMIGQNGELAQSLQDSSTNSDILRGELFAVRSDRVALEADLQEKTQGLADLQSQIETLETERASLTAQVDELTAQSSTLQADNDAAAAALAETQEQLTARENELAELNQQIDGLCQQLGIAEEISEETPAEPVEGEEGEAPAARKLLGIGALGAGVATAAARGDQVDDLTAQAASLTEQVESLTTENEALKADVALKDQTIDELNSQVETLNGSVTSLQEELAASQAELDELNAQVDAAHEALKEFVPEAEQPAEDEEGRPVAKAAALTALVGGAAGALHRGKSQEDDHAAQVASYDEQVASLTAEKTDLDARLQEQTVQVETLTAQLAETQESLNAVTSAKVELEAAAQEKDQSLADYNDGFLDLQGQVNKLAADKSMLETSLQLKEEELAQLQEQLAAQQADLADLEEATERSTGSRMAGVGAVTAGAAAAAALRDKDTQLEETTARLATLEEQVVSLDAARGTLEADLASRDEELAGVRAEMEALQAQLDGALAEKSAADESLAQQAAELEATRSRLAAAAPFAEATGMSDKLAQMPAVKRDAAAAAILAGVQPRFMAGVQPLNDIHGIGQAFQQRLYDSGIGTFWEVSCLSDATMQESLQVPETQLDRLDYGGIRASAYQHASETDTIGALWEVSHIDDFQELPGIGAAFEKRLYAAGILTFGQLIDAGKERLAGILQAPEFRQPDFDGVIEAARARLAEAAEAAADQE